PRLLPAATAPGAASTDERLEAPGLPGGGWSGTRAGGGGAEALVELVRPHPKELADTRQHRAPSYRINRTCAAGIVEAGQIRLHGALSTGHRRVGAELALHLAPLEGQRVARVRDARLERIAPMCLVELVRIHPFRQ